MPFRTLLTAALLVVSGAALAQTGGVTVGAAGAPDASAALEVRSTTQGLLLPRLTLAQRNAVAAPAAGLVLYQTDNAPGLYAYDGTAWVRLGGDNLGSHAATQNLNLQAYALVGNGADIGTATGVGIRGDGGLNLGQNTTGNNLYVGYQAGRWNSFGRNNLFFGYQSGYANTFGSFNQFSGYQSGFNNVSGSNNLFNGYQSGFSNTQGRNNFFSGYQSGYANTTGNNNQFTGYLSGRNNTTGSSNLFSGIQSGSSNTTGSQNQFTGYNSGLSNTTGENNLFSGYQSGSSNSTGSNNLYIGHSSGRGSFEGNYNQFTGHYSGYFNISGNYNQFSGYESGFYNQTGNNNLFVGYQAGYNNSEGSSNQFMGFTSGYATSTGSNNLFVGYSAGYYNETGTYNTALGHAAGPSSSDLTNTTALGYQASVSQSNSLVLGGTGSNAVRVGIGTAAPAQQLELAGQDAPTVLLHSSGNGQLAGGTLQFRESNLVYGWNLRHNTGASEGGSSADRLVLEAVNNGTADPLMTWDENNKRVGIGTVAPAVRLDVTSPANTTAAFASTASDPNGVLTLTVPATNAACNTCSEFVEFFKAGSSNFLGSIYANLSGNAVVYATTSDRRMKEHITPTHFGLADLLKLQVKDYNFIGQPATARTTGLLAQDLFQVYPDAVKQGDAGPVVRDAWAVDYGRLTPLLIQAIQDQQKQIEALKADAAAQRQRADRAEASTAGFEQRLRALEAAGACAEAGR
ncbi:tail fiber domain-containing protein [Hymenobacter sp. BT523]|uniref:tail fiber domain-containing protein n=1 Tax=Hymenobacter sp. BT523 TaxID=2795725 RepID=UPI0018ECDB22|nr:tail fiber domain-containing protein [Hymenobacter sp. BT523]MBJ6110800.1 tail fiber domain-containing protein [Hymenobacter sp. BT523]